MPNRPALALMIAAGITAALPGCARFPQLDATVSDAVRAQPYPDLIPLEGFETDAAAPRITPQTAPQLEARIAQLQARADRLRGTVIDPATRDRMQTGIAR